MHFDWKNFLFFYFSPLASCAFTMVQTSQKWNVQHFMQAAGTDDHIMVAWEAWIVCVWHHDVIFIFCAMGKERMNCPTSPPPPTPTPTPNRPFNAMKMYATTYWRVRLLAYKISIDAGKGKYWPFDQITPPNTKYVISFICVWAPSAGFIFDLIADYTLIYCT